MALALLPPLPLPPLLPLLLLRQLRLLLCQLCCLLPPLLLTEQGSAQPAKEEGPTTTCWDSRLDTTCQAGGGARHASRRPDALHQLLATTPAHACCTFVHLGSRLPQACRRCARSLLAHSTAQQGAPRDACGEADPIAWAMLGATTRSILSTGVCPTPACRWPLPPALLNPQRSTGIQRRDVCGNARSHPWRPCLPTHLQPLRCGPPSTAATGPRDQPSRRIGREGSQLERGGGWRAARAVELPAPLTPAPDTRSLDTRRTACCNS